MQYIIVILGILGLDQATKWWIVSHFAIGESLTVNGLLQLTYVQNTGAAFSILSNNTLFLIILTFLVLAAVIYFWRKPYIRPYHWVLAVIVGGALGNFVDRLFRGYVVDFFQVTFINFPVFNVADIVLCCGVIFLALKILFGKEAEADENHISK